MVTRDNISKLAKSSLVALALPLMSVVLFLGTVKQIEAQACPLVLDLSGNGRIDITGHNTAREKLYTVFSIGKYVSFDIFGNNQPLDIDWVAPNTDAFLVDFRSGVPEKITGANLFGQSTGDTDTGENFADGFQKLKSLDKNSDGVVSGKELKGVKLWKDNGDAVLAPKEIIELSVFGISSIPAYGNEAIGSYGAKQLVNTVHSTIGEIYMEDIWFMSSEQPPHLDTVMGRALHFFS